MDIKNILEQKLGKSIADSSKQEIYVALLNITKDMSEEKVQEDTGKKVYYISAEFLIGKLLSNNLINLGIYADVKKVLADNGISLAEIEEIEAEPSLGNGGLGRLAACFLDSIASLGLNGSGIVLTTILDYSSRYLRIISRKRLQIHGLRRIHSLEKQM